MPAFSISGGIFGVGTGVKGTLCMSLVNGMPSDVAGRSWNDVVRRDGSSQSSSLQGFSLFFHADDD